MASVIPDIDLLFFYFVDHRQTLHHDYWTHLPIFWLCAWAVVLLLNLFLKNRMLLYASTIFFANIFLHLLLDTFAAGIPWLAPFSWNAFVLVTVPARYPLWIENFVFHWTFLVELAIVSWAAIALAKEQKPPV